MSLIKPRKIILIPIEAKEGEIIHQECEHCGYLLKSGLYVIVIQIIKQNHKINLFLGCEVDCKTCQNPNTVIKIFKNESKMTAELYMLREDITASNGIINRKMIPNTPQEDTEDLLGE
jgi:hypothetical protein